MRFPLVATASLLAACGQGTVGGGTDAATDADATMDVRTFVDAPLVFDDALGPAPDASGGFAPDGPFAVATWTGTVAGTIGTARVLYATNVEGRMPVVAFAHGFQLTPGSYDGLLSHIASWGFVVISVDYAQPLLGFDHRNVARALHAARLAASAGIPGFPANSSIDGDRVVAMGHSVGGKGAIMAVLDDPGFVAAIALDPVDDNPAPGGMPSDATPSIAPEQMYRLQRPLALFGATQSRCAQPFQACAPEASNYLQFAAAAPAGAQVAIYPLANFGHTDFVDTGCTFTCDLCARGATPLDSRVTALRTLSVAFLWRFARGETAFQRYVDGDAREALVTAGVLWNQRPDTLPACR